MINHVGLIPDGNRRWATKNSLNLDVAYNQSMVHIHDLIDHFFSKNISLVSVYLLSRENLSRGRDDIDAVLVAEEYLFKTLLPLCIKWDCKVIQAGLPSLLPSQFANAIENLVQATADLSKKKLYLLVGYNPLDEVNSALKKEGGEIRIEDLWVKDKLDMVIRTAGGNVPLSNFLPLQSGYAQIFIVNELFNDFTLDQFDELYNKASKTVMLLGK